MNWLLDTNILLAAADPVGPDCQVARDAVDVIRARGDAPVVGTQVMYEFCVSSTRPVANNGRGLPPAQATAELADLETQYAVLIDRPDVYATWKSLVTTYGVSGKPAHDARLVAVMTLVGITHILTFNAKHFTRFPGIVPVHPSTLVGP